MRYYRDENRECCTKGADMSNPGELSGQRYRRKSFFVGLALGAVGTIVGVLVYASVGGPWVVAATIAVAWFLFRVRREAALGALIGAMLGLGAVLLWTISIFGW
jgi:hypothetical protein